MDITFTEITKARSEELLLNMDNNEVEEEKAETPEKIIKYVGATQDNQWWEKITVEEDPKQTTDEIYRILVEKMGIFRWQTPQYVHICCI